MNHRLRNLGLLAFLLATAGCRTASTMTWDPVQHAYARPAETLLQPGSTVEVRFHDTPELNVEQSVLPDGTISLPMIGPFRVAGKSVDIVERELRMLYGKELREPQLSVIVLELANQSVAIGGQVQTPGRVEMPDSITVLDAIMQAGGPDQATADLRNVIVLRESAGERHGYLVDLVPSLRGEASAPFYLEPRDIVFVPPTRVTRVNQWIDQYINQMVPQFGFTFTKDIGDSARIGIDTSRGR